MILLASGYRISEKIHHQIRFFFSIRLKFWPRGAEICSRVIASFTPIARPASPHFICHHAVQPAEARTLQKIHARLLHWHDTALPRTSGAIDSRKLKGKLPVPFAASFRKHRLLR
jgi:hypothetical protein